jgi:hypothetical protein
VRTINEPPATATFDVANKHRELRECHNGHNCHVSGARSTSGSSPIAADSLTAMAQLAMTALSLAKHITDQSSTQQMLLLLVLCQSNAPELLSLFSESCGPVSHSTSSGIVCGVLECCGCVRATLLSSLFGCGSVIPLCLCLFLS